MHLRTIAECDRELDLVHELTDKALKRGERRKLGNLRTRRTDALRRRNELQTAPLFPLYEEKILSAQVRL